MNSNTQMMPNDELVTIIVPKRPRRKTDNNPNNPNNNSNNPNNPLSDKDQKISDLNRQLYYLKKYGLEILPPKRDYKKKPDDFRKLKVKKEKIVLSFS